MSRPALYFKKGEKNMAERFCPTCGKKVIKGKYCSKECYYNRGKKKVRGMQSTHTISSIAYTKFSNLSEENKKNIEKLIKLTQEARKSRVPVSRLKKVHNLRTFKKFADMATVKVLKEFMEATRLDERKFEEKRKIVAQILKERENVLQ